MKTIFKTVSKFAVLPSLRPLRLCAVDGTALLDLVEADGDNLDVLFHGPVFLKEIAMADHSPLPRGITPAQIEETRTTWEPLYGRPLSDEDCLEIFVNVYRLFDILFDEKLKQSARHQSPRQLAVPGVQIPASRHN